MENETNGLAEGRQRGEEEEELVAALTEELSFRLKRVIARETWSCTFDVLYPLLDLDFFIQESSGAVSCL